MTTSSTLPRNVGPEPTPRSSFSHSLGLRVAQGQAGALRVTLDTTQRCLFAEGPSILTRLAEELCVSVARIVVCDFRIHSRLNRTVPAVLRNVRLSFWSCARRAALDTSAALAAGAKHRVMQSDLAIQAANLALRIAELCEKAEQAVRGEKQVAQSYEAVRRSDFAAMFRRQREARQRAETEASFSSNEESR